MSSISPNSTDFKSHFPRGGRVEWIGLRPGRGVATQLVQSVVATTEEGLIGDRFAGKRGSPRQVTLIQHEHLPAIASMMGVAEVDPALTRRNLVISGINLTALKGAEFAIGDAVLLATGACAPCSQMERNLGPGGFNAMRGHGGITATVVRGGSITRGDEVRLLRLAGGVATREEE